MSVNVLDQFDTTYLDPADRDAVEWLEAQSWVVTVAAPANPKAGIPAVYAAESFKTIPVRRQQAHTVTALRRAVSNDLERRGVSPVVVVHDGPAVATTSQGRAS